MKNIMYELEVNTPTHLECKAMKKHLLFTFILNLPSIHLLGFPFCGTSTSHRVVLLGSCSLSETRSVSHQSSPEMGGGDVHVFI